MNDKRRDTPRAPPAQDSGKTVDRGGKLNPVKEQRERDLPKVTNTLPPPPRKKP
jgi:hypothetical protein